MIHLSTELDTLYVERGEEFIAEVYDLSLFRNLVEFGPILPHSTGFEENIIIHNPCSFPVEIYNLEFDKGYLEEEKILRLMKGYDEFNTILLPPRTAGDKLPPELIEYYEGTKVTVYCGFYSIRLALNF